MEPSKLSPEADHAVYFRKFIQQLAQKFEPIQVFSFSKTSYARTDNGFFNANKASFRCDYCLLVVTETATRIDYEMQDFANSHYRQGIITIICHGKESIIEAMQNNSRFFISVLNHGKLLYSRDGILDVDPIPLFNPVNGASKALRHYDHRMPLADGFLMCASECLEKGQYGICAFMLHQAVEQTCICLIRVHIAYRSEFHNLYRLLRLCLCFSDQPYEMFLSTPEDEKLFDVMAKSYSSARYRDSFSVSKQDADGLYNRTLSFLALARVMCREKIELLEQEAALHTVLQIADGVQIETTAQTKNQTYEKASK